MRKMRMHLLGRSYNVEPEAGYPAHGNKEIEHHDSPRRVAHVQVLQVKTYTQSL